MSKTLSPMPGRPLKVLVADDHGLMRAAVLRVLSEQDDIEIVGEATGGDEVLPLVLATEPDVVLLDIGMPGVDGIQCVREMRKRVKNVRILMLTAYGDQETVSAAERAGADGYVLKSIPAGELVELLEAPVGEGFLVAGFPDPEDDLRLTEREAAVLDALCEGLTNREIGRRLWISQPTVKFHLGNLFRKLSASNRKEAVEHARERGLVWAGDRRSVARH